ncbi:ATP-binding protein [Microcoleus sp. herbarium12]|uniref:ATP-binding protein n=1 Tax=Microcoleus sp. herbarium12 TaxID=3055437 RepID=UPI002FD7684B
MIELKGSEKLQVLKKADLQVNTGLNALELVLSWFSQLYEPRIPRSVWIRCQLVLAEGFTNAVRHAHQGQPPDLLVEIEVAVCSECIEIKIWDSGAPFDLEQKIKEMSKEIDPEASGGRGLKLMKDIADNLSYRRTAAGRNCLWMVKNYTPVPNTEDEDDILQLPEELSG